MKKIIYDKLAYVAAILLISFISWLMSVNMRISTLEAGANKVDTMDKKISKILCILGERSECGA